MSKVSKSIKIVLLASILLLVFVVACTDQTGGGGGGCSSAAAQGWSGFSPYNKVLCFGSMEGKVIAIDPQARSDNMTFPATGEWVYVIKTATPGAGCGAMSMCSSSSSAAGAGIYDTPVVVDNLTYAGTYTG